MKIKPINTLEFKISISKQNFTREAIDFFDAIKQKLIELRIEPNEAKEYLRQLIEKIQEIGFIPPLIINLLRDVDNNYQTLIVSLNLSSEEEKIISACIKPTIIGSNEIIPQTKSKEIILTCKEVVPINDFTAPFSAISAQIYNVVINYTKGNKIFANEFTEKVINTLEKISKTQPLLATHRLPSISQLMFEQSMFQINQTGILMYLQKQKAILEYDNNYHIKKVV